MNHTASSQSTRGMGGLGQRLLQLALVLGIAGLVYKALGGRIDDVIALDRGLADPHLGWLALSSFLLLLAYALAARMWGWMMGEIGATDPGARLSIQILMAANLGRYVPGKIWQLAGLAVLAQRRGIPPLAAAGSSLVVQGFTLAATLVWSLPILLSGSSMEPGTRGLVMGGMLMAGVVLASIPKVTHAGIRLLYHLGRQPMETAPIPSWSFGTRWLLMNLLLWGVYGIAFLVFVRGLGFEVDAPQTLVAFTASYLIGNLLVVAPAGIGIREVALAGFLLPQLESAAMPVAILARLWMTLLEVGPAAAFAWLELRGKTP